MFGLLNAPSPERASSLGARPRSAPRSGKLDTFAALTVPTMCPLVCCAASGFFIPERPRTRSQRKGPSELSPCALLGPTRRRRAPLATVASQECLRGVPSNTGLASVGPHGLKQRPPTGGWTAAAGRGDTQRKPAIRLELGGGHLANKARRALVFEGHSYAFARQVALTEATARRLPCNDHGHWPSAPSGSRRGCEADRSTRCRAGEGRAGARRVLGADEPAKPW